MLQAWIPLKGGTKREFYAGGQKLVCQSFALSKTMKYPQTCSPCFLSQSDDLPKAPYTMDNKRLLQLLGKGDMPAENFFL